MRQATELAQSKGGQSAQEVGQLRPSSSGQAFSFANTRRAKNGPCRIT